MDIPENKPRPKRKGLSSKHTFLQVRFVRVREGGRTKKQMAFQSFEVIKENVMANQPPPRKRTRQEIRA